MSCRARSIVVTADYTVVSRDYQIRADATAGPITITLLNPTTNKYTPLSIEKIDATANEVRLVANGGAPINGVYVSILSGFPALTAQWDSVILRSQGTSYDWEADASQSPHFANIFVSALATAAGLDIGPGSSIFNGVIVSGANSWSITTNKDDWDWGQLGVKQSILRVDTDASRDVTGFAALAYCHLWVVNVGSFNLVLKHQNAGSTAPNRIITADGLDLTLTPSQSTHLWHDGITSRWRVIA